MATVTKKELVNRIAEKTGQFGGSNLREKWDVYQWVMWQMANQGPKTGERGHFARLKDSQGDQSYALRRFNDELHRLYGVMNNRLYDRRYLAGDHYTIADMACYPWSCGWEAQGIDIELNDICTLLEEAVDGGQGCD